MASMILRPRGSQIFIRRFFFHEKWAVNIFKQNERFSHYSIFACNEDDPEGSRYIFLILQRSFSGFCRARLVADDAGTSRMCGLKPQEVVGAAVSSTGGVLCATCFHWMISHDAAVIPRERSPSDDDFRGERYETRVEAEADLAGTRLISDV